MFSCTFFPMLCLFSLYAFFPLSQAVAIMKAKGITSGFSNLSQSIERQGLTQHIPCITPRGEFWSMKDSRYLTGHKGLKCYILRLVFKGVCIMCFYFGKIAKPLPLADVEKFLYQSFPVQKLNLVNLTKREP